MFVLLLLFLQKEKRTTTNKNKKGLKREVLKPFRGEGGQYNRDFPWSIL